MSGCWAGGSNRLKDINVMKRVFLDCMTHDRRPGSYNAVKSFKMFGFDKDEEAMSRTLAELVVRKYQGEPLG
jgi:hypothetical protein